MSTEQLLLRKYGGVNKNSLNHVLNIVNTDDEDESTVSDVTLIKHSPYVNNDEFLSFCLERAKDFTILSLNIQSIRAKFDQFLILLNQLKHKDFAFSAICLQETWLSADTDVTLLQIPGYTLIHQGTISSSHGGLAFYLNEAFKYKLLPIYKGSTIWEGLFIEIF